MLGVCEYMHNLHMFFCCEDVSTNWTYVIVNITYIDVSAYVCI